MKHSPKLPDLFRQDILATLEYHCPWFGLRYPEGHDRPGRDIQKEEVHILKQPILSANDCFIEEAPNLSENHFLEASLYLTC